MSIYDFIDQELNKQLEAEDGAGAEETGGTVTEVDPTMLETIE